ncbi:hypothetical protein SCG7109_BB_00080 [Chlamydiales bacterium SCGC AG-110-M15]|nr:hypothetical protein SCG7109_BB_00080 [Chlamydiales bacterium SCGC AG-110-M15]
MQYQSIQKKKLYTIDYLIAPRRTSQRDETKKDVNC